ncbi:MAG: NAD(P)-binding domain-containing protein [Polyangiaceae bacterium]
MTPPAPEHRTLLHANLADARERTADPREAGRGRTAVRAARTSDTTRFSAALLATIASIVAAALAAFLMPPPGGHAAPGPLSRPHVKAGLDCTACHSPAGPGPSAACAGCHGAHTSARAGHAKMIATGAMKCSTCHPIHQGDQGVIFAPGKPPVRFAPGVEVEVDPTGFVPARPAVVPIVTAKACKGCHAIGDARDPASRCFAPAQEPLADARPSMCFDEHEIAHPDDALPPLDPRDRPRTPRSPGSPGSPRPPRGQSTSTAPGARPAGVCSAQHTTDRAAAWAAAREVALRVPVTEARKSAGLPWFWLGSGLLAFALVFGGTRAFRWSLAFARSRKPAPVQAALLKPATRKRLPTIHTATCIGCYACVDACPYDVLEIDRYVAVVARPEACCGLVLCAQRCPNGSLTISDGEAIGERPRLTDDLESSDTPGLFLAGDVTGLPLIKNAILQGAHAVTRIADAAKRRPPPPDRPLDLLIIGAGPAGISAALRAKELGLTYEVIEQGTVAQSIQSFPRGKLVFDQPLDLPVTGALWLKESTKEELLAQWLRIVRKEQLAILQDTRMLSVTPREDGTFTVLTEPREGGPTEERRSRFVLLAIGQRGTPRRLPIDIPPEVEHRVHYHLADARSFADRSVVIVGLGDVAMETAIALSRQPGTRVSLVYRGDDFSRGQGRNIAAVKRLVADGRIALHFRAELTSIAARHAVIRIAPPGARIDHLPCDAIFVMIGSIPPSSTLRSAGIRTVAEATPSLALKTLLSPGTPLAPDPPLFPNTAFRRHPPFRRHPLSLTLHFVRISPFAGIDCADIAFRRH